MSFISLEQISGKRNSLGAVADEKILGLKARVEAQMGLDTKRLRVAIVSALNELADTDAVPECPELKLTLVIRKIDCFEQVGPEMRGCSKYIGAGVVTPSGCIYFAPSCAGKVLRVSADGAIEQVGPEIPGGTSTLDQAR